MPLMSDEKPIRGKKGKKSGYFGVLRGFISVEKDNEWCFPMQNLGWFGNSDRLKNLDYLTKKKIALIRK